MYWIFYDSSFEFVSTNQGGFIVVIANEFLDDKYNLVEGSDSVLSEALHPKFFRLRSRKRTDLFYTPGDPSLRGENFKPVYEKMGMRGLVFIEEEFPFVVSKKQ